MISTASTPAAAPAAVAALSAADGRFTSEIPLAPLADEFIAMAKLVVTTTSIAIAVTRSRLDPSAGLLSRYLPSNPTISPVIAPPLALVDQHRVLARRLDEFYRRSAYLRGLTICYCAAFESASNAMDELHRLAEGWQEVARAGVAVAEALDFFEGLEASRAVRSRLAFALQAVVDGGTPALDVHGNVVDVMPERRQQFRAIARRQIYVGVGDSIQRALVVDAASRGIGLWGVRDAVPGQSIDIMWGPGKSSAATVVWADGLRAGISLNAADDASRALIAALIQGDDAAI